MARVQIFTENVRQKDDPKFFEMLNRIRVAAPTEDDIEKLLEKLVNIPADSDKINEAAKLLKEKLDNKQSYLC